MRVTTQMLHRANQRAGFSGNNNSLLNYINGGNGNNNVLPQSVQKSKSTAKMNSTQKTKYEKLEKAAEGLEKQADKLTAAGEESLFEKAKASGDYTEVYKEIGSLVESYNAVFSQLESMPDTMNDFYRQSMQTLVKENKESLSGIGITLDKRGRLQVDKEKLEAADKEKVEKVLGKAGKFTSKLSFLASHVDDSAESNLTSVSGGYSSKGSFTGTTRNRFDSKG